MHERSKKKRDLSDTEKMFNRSREEFRRSERKKEQRLEQVKEKFERSTGYEKPKKRTGRAPTVLESILFWVCIFALLFGLATRLLH